MPALISSPRTNALPFDLWSLEVFLAVCDTGSMSDAARRLVITQPAISQVVRSLEQKLGVILLDRTLRPIQPTAAGSALAERARGLLNDARTLAPAVRHTARAAPPALRIGLLDSIAVTLGPAIVEALRGKVNHLTIWVGLSFSHNQALLERRLDMAFTASPLEDAEDIERHMVVEEPFVLAYPAQHASRLPRHPTLGDLAASLALVRYTSRSHFGVTIDRYLRLLGEDIPRKLEFDSSEMVFAMVAAGLGFAVTTPTCALQGRDLLGQLRFAPLPAPGLRRTLMLIARRGELGPLPAATAQIARQVLRGEAFAGITSRMPRQGAGISFGSGGAAINRPSR